MTGNMAGKRRVIVIGAGASGMTAAIHAAKAGASVTVLEHMDRAGRKILATGNGRCNFSNRDQRPEYYRCGQKDFPWKVISRFPEPETERFFEGLGILIKDRNGYLYPNSDQASSILGALFTELERREVRVRLNCHAEKAEKQGGEFVISAGQGIFRADALVLAAGSKAAPKTGSDGSGYELVRAFGHYVIPPLPALVQLRCAEKDYKQLGGIRTDARVRLFAEKGKGVAEKGKDVLLAEDRGELQLTEYGISGIPVFQVSRYASVALREGLRVRAEIDFLPDLSLEETEEMLRSRLRAMSDTVCARWTNGLLNGKLCAVLLKRAGIPPERKAGDVPERSWRAFLKQLKAFETRVTGTNPFDRAQVCCGGVDTREVNPETLESRRTPGLYFAGEILDVDGICGGYNLQWAWSSGAVAGSAAGRDRSEHFS